MENQYCYKYPRPALTTDQVIFGFGEGELRVLLIRRGNEPFKGKWALPGGFMDMDEDAETCARRELEEETGLKVVNFEHLYAFSDVDRDPRYRVVSIAYYALVRWEDCKVKAGDDADRAQWFPLSGIPPLAFDHRRILQMAADRLKLKARYRPIGIDLLPPEFKMADLRHLYESVLQCTLDRDNFRRKMVGTGLLVDAEQENRAKNGRKVRYYLFDRVKYRYFTEKCFYLKWE